jgi:hypothetical protein
MEKWNDGCQTENQHCERAARSQQDTGLEVENNAYEDTIKTAQEARRTRCATVAGSRQAVGAQARAETSARYAAGKRIAHQEADVEVGQAPNGLTWRNPELTPQQTILIVS